MATSESFSIPFTQGAITATGTHHGEPVVLPPALVDAITYWQSCPDDEVEAAAAHVNLLINNSQKEGTQNHA